MNARGPYVASSLGHLIVLGTLLTFAALQQSPSIIPGVRIVSLPGRGRTSPATITPRPAAPVETKPKVEPVAPAPVPKTKVPDKTPPKRQAAKPADARGMHPAAKPEIVSKTQPKTPDKPPAAVAPPRATSAAAGAAAPTSTVGIEAEGADGIVSSYLSLLRDKVASNWEPPPEIGRSGAARTVVTFVIGRDGGAPLQVRVEGESGVSIYDRKALAAIENSKPFQPLPSGWENDSIAIRFTFQQDY